ncbi:MAG: hypothetical protein KGS72_03535 [Cyanobacteria bacterium REEB67]|nr:hypothetical protein [Cyanobacteria bacterium REEB67]
MKFSRYQAKARSQVLLLACLSAFCTSAQAVPTEGDEVFNPAEHEHSMEKALPLRTDPLPTGVSPADVPAGPMTELPVTPEQVDPGLANTQAKAPVASSPDSKLTGSASTLAGIADDAPSPKAPNALMGVAKGMTVNPLTRYKGPRLVYIELTIRNTSDSPVVLLGEGIRGQATGKTVYPVGYEKIVKLDQNVMTTKSKLAVAALGAGSLGLTSVIGYEVFAPQEYRKRNPGTATGRDRGRHEIEEGRFNRRVLLPQDETTGWVAFYASDSDTLSSLTLPLLTPPYTTSSGSVSIPIYGVNVAMQAAQAGAVNGKPTTVYSIK